MAFLCRMLQFRFYRIENSARQSRLSSLIFVPVIYLLKSNLPLSFLFLSFTLFSPPRFLFLFLFLFFWSKNPFQSDRLKIGGNGMIVWHWIVGKSFFRRASDWISLESCLLLDVVDGSVQVCGPVAPNSNLAVSTGTMTVETYFMKVF